MFIHCLSIFLAWKTDFRVYFQSFNRRWVEPAWQWTCHCVPHFDWVSGAVPSCRHVRGCKRRWRSNRSCPNAALASPRYAAAPPLLAVAVRASRSASFPLRTSPAGACSRRRCVKPPAEVAARHQHWSQPSTAVRCQALPRTDFSPVSMQRRFFHLSLSRVQPPLRRSSSWHRQSPPPSSVSAAVAPHAVAGRAIAAQCASRERARIAALKASEPCS
jgi:hypothetical protein